MKQQQLQWRHTKHTYSQYEMASMWMCQKWNFVMFEEPNVAWHTHLHIELLKRRLFGIYLDGNYLCTRIRVTSKHWISGTALFVPFVIYHQQEIQDHQSGISKQANRVNCGTFCQMLDFEINANTQSHWLNIQSNLSTIVGRFNVERSTCSTRSTILRTNQLSYRILVFGYHKRKIT